MSDKDIKELDKTLRAAIKSYSHLISNPIRMFYREDSTMFKILFPEKETKSKEEPTTIWEAFKKES